MKHSLTLDDLMMAGIPVVAGLLAAFLLRILLRWLGKHASRTRWSGDDFIVDALRTLVPGERSPRVSRRRARSFR